MRRKALKRNCNLKKKRRLRRKVELMRLIEKKICACEEYNEANKEV
ncbi:MAG: hypothetical protein ACRC6T_17020 [Sarcina sp.]